MTERLFNRQASLLEYLTSRPAIFGDRDAPIGAALAGINPSLLRLEARFSHQKRMEKIVAVFPRTFKLMTSRLDRIVPEFVEACVPAEIGLLANARQFQDFLTAQWVREAPEPPWLPDVVALEFACADVRNTETVVAPNADDDNVSAGEVANDVCAIRRQPAVRLVRCSFDVRPIFEDGCIGAGAEGPAERDTCVAVGLTPDQRHVQIYQLPPVVFELLSAVADWTDPTELGIVADFDDVLRELAGRGLIEVRP